MRTRMEKGFFIFRRGEGKRISLLLRGRLLMCTVVAKLCYGAWILRLKLYFTPYTAQ